MKLSKEELHAFRPGGNKVLVRSIVSMDSILLGGKKIYIDTTYKPENHVEVICEVVATPKRLLFDRKRPAGESMEWKTTCELKKGDIVWVNYLSVIRGKESFTIECDGINYFMVEYGSIYLKKDKLEVTMLNGWILCEPVYVNVTESEVAGHKIFLPKLKSVDQLEGVAQDTQFGRVKHLGRPIREYHGKDSPPDDDFLRVGDTVMFVTAHNVRLEHELHRHFNGQELIISRRSRILGVVDF